MWFKMPQNTTPAAQLGICLMDRFVEIVFIYGELDAPWSRK